MAIFRDDDGRLYWSDRSAPVLAPAGPAGDGAAGDGVSSADMPLAGLRLIRPERWATIARTSLHAALTGLVLGGAGFALWLAGHPAAGALGGLGFLVLVLGSVAVQRWGTRPAPHDRPLTLVRPQPPGPAMLFHLRSLALPLLVFLMLHDWMVRTEPDNVRLLLAALGALFALASTIVAVRQLRELVQALRTPP